MTPSELKKATLSNLRSLQETLNSSEWILALEDEKEDATRHEAALLLLNVNRAKVRLENTALADVRDALIANEPALNTGRKDMEKALEKPEKVAKVLEKATAYLGTVTQVLAKLK